MEHLKYFFQLVKHLGYNVGADGPTLPRKRKATKRYEVGEGEGYHSPILSEHYRRLYFKVIVTSGIKHPFDQVMPSIPKFKGTISKIANKED